MVGENFCPWGGSGLICQQINMFYFVSLCDETQISLEGTFKALDEMGNIRFDIYNQIKMALSWLARECWAMCIL